MFEKTRVDVTLPDPTPSRFNDEKTRRRARTTTVTDRWGKYRQMLKRRKKKGYSVSRKNGWFSRFQERAAAR